MLELVKDFEKRLEEINDQLVLPEILSNQNKLKNLSRERRHVEEVLQTGHKYRDCLTCINEAREIISHSDDKDLIELAKEELEENSQNLPALEDQLSLLLKPRDPNDDKNSMVEIRAGTGGNEAAIFAADLFRMYRKFSEYNNWKIETLSTSAIELGGLKEIIFMIKGEGAYGKMKYESGVHRVQRVPQTESSGRIHTSAATVAVLLEAEDIDLEINENELKIDVYRSSGPGGQSVNTTDSAVRITHIPSNTVVTCQDEKSQHKNKARAMQVLRTRLMNKIKDERDEEIARERRSMVSTGDRSAKIRTYNFPQSRVTDHRIKLTVHNLNEILDGHIHEIVSALHKHDQEQNLKNIGNSAK